MEKERVFVLIDGNNFYHRLKELSGPKGGLLDFQYTDFTKWLAAGRHIVQQAYYIGVVRATPDDQKGQLMRRDQQRLFARLQSSGWRIVHGYLLKTDGVHHEKGVDVHMAVDLLVGAYENTYDTVIFVSSDTDLIPALAKIRSMDKKVEYVGFSQRPSYGLIAHSDIRRLLVKEDMEPFLPPRDLKR